MLHLWLASDLIGSKLIRWGTGGLASHYAVVFNHDEHGHGLVFHSKMTGVRMTSYKHLLNDYRVIYSLEQINAPAGLAHDVYARLIDEYYGDFYDFPGMLYFSYRAFLYRIFDIAFPEKNFLSTSDPLCVGIANVFKEFNDYYQIQWPKDLDMTSPDKLYAHMEQSPVLFNPRLVGLRDKKDIGLY